MTTRQRKQQLLQVLQLKARAFKLTKEQADSFELMYRKARTHEEQDQVTQALDSLLIGWRERNDAWSQLRRNLDDDDSPFAL